MTLATVDPATCPDCGEPLRHLEYDQAALFTHGGYGATTRTIYATCVCGWSMQRERSERRP